MYRNKIIDFIKKSPTPFHAVAEIKNILLKAGYTECSENDLETMGDGGKHFVIRSNSSIIAFRGACRDGGFMICSSHCDVPAFKVKSEVSGNYLRLSSEKYGGMIYYSWLDRPLSVAGRVVVRTEGGVRVALCDIDKDSFVIPSVAIHFNRTVNDGYKFNPAVDMLPLSGTKDGGVGLLKLVAQAVGAAEEDIISHDLFLYNREEGRVFGSGDEFLLSPRLDDLGCVFCSLEAFLSADDSDVSVPVLAVFDNEEVGSSTKQGANSTFLDMTLSAIAGDDMTYRKMLSDSFMVSADNAHAIHPNHPELSDPQNAPVLCGGVVIKYNSNQLYTTDAISSAVFKTLAKDAGAKVQSFAMRADMPCGSTLGSIANTRVSIPSVDIGLPQLAMHSSTETVGISDLEDAVKVLRRFYSSGLKVSSDEIKIIDSGKGE